MLTSTCPRTILLNRYFILEKVPKPPVVCLIKTAWRPQAVRADRYLNHWVSSDPYQNKCHSGFLPFPLKLLAISPARMHCRVVSMLTETMESTQQSVVYLTHSMDIWRKKPPNPLSFCNAVLGYLSFGRHSPICLWRKKNRTGKGRWAIHSILSLLS